MIPDAEQKKLPLVWAKAGAEGFIHNLQFIPNIL